jgi:hypothetical protein
MKDEHWVKFFTKITYHMELGKCSHIARMFIVWLWSARVPMPYSLSEFIVNVSFTILNTKCNLLSLYIQSTNHTVYGTQYFSISLWLLSVSMFLYLLLYKHYYGSLRTFVFFSCIVCSMLVCECSVLLIIVYMVYVLCSFAMFSFFPFFYSIVFRD